MIIDMVLELCGSVSIHFVGFKREQRGRTAGHLGGNHEAEQVHKVTWRMRVNYAASTSLYWERALSNDAHPQQVMAAASLNNDKLPALYNNVRRRSYR